MKLVFYELLSLFELKAILVIFFTERCKSKNVDYKVNYFTIETVRFNFNSIKPLRNIRRISLKTNNI